MPATGTHVSEEGAHAEGWTRPPPQQCILARISIASPTPGGKPFMLKRFNLGHLCSLRAICGEARLILYPFCSQLEMTVAKPQLGQNTTQMQFLPATKTHVSEQRAKGLSRARRGTRQALRPEVAAVTEGPLCSFNFRLSTVNCRPSSRT